VDFEPSMSRSVSTHFANAAQHDSGFENSSSDSSSRFQFSSQFKSSEFKSSHKEQQTMEQRISSLMAKKDWRLNKDGSVDKRQKEFRELNQLAHYSPIPLNSNGTPDKRFTSNTDILQYKLHCLLAKNN